MNYQPGTKLKLGPMSGLGTDAYWMTITAVAPDGEITTADEDGMVDHVPAAIWAEEYARRVLETVEPDANPDEPPMEPDEYPEDEEEPEEIPFGAPESCPGEEAYAPPAEPAPGYVARNMAQNAESLKLAGVDPRAVMHDPTDRTPTPLERLADMVNRKFNLEAMARKCQEDAGELTGQIWKILTDAAKAQLMPTTSPAGVPDPLAVALGEAIEERAPQENPPVVEEIPTAQAQSIAESVAAQVREEAASADYETISRLEMNRALREVRGISDAQASRMAALGIKTLANFCQAVEERPTDWWSGMLYINAAKGDLIEQAVEDHWKRFRRQHKRV